MKQVPQVLNEVRNYIDKGWHLDATDNGAGRWPRTFTVGTISSREADARYKDVVAWAHSWYDWAISHNIQLVDEPRRIRGIDQRLPTHITFYNVDAAAAAVADGWTSRLATARRRAAEITAAFPDADAPSALRLATPLDTTDFGLAVTAARWLRENPDVWPGLTPRQTPIEGLHGKWLNRHQPLLLKLTGYETLDFQQRPTRIHWTYLDPTYLATGRRRHDSHTIGDNIHLPYTPKTVLIIENKDTAVLFPPLEQAVAVEGNGNAAPALLPRIPWIVAADNIIYWGDIDTAGYEILDRLRAGLPTARSILMDHAAYSRYEKFGTNTDDHGKPLKARNLKPCTRLTAAERAVYVDLAEASWCRHRRIEQERIPLATARRHAAAATR